MHRVIDAVLALLDLDLAVATDADDCDAAGKLGEALLQFFAVVIRGGFLDLRLDLGNPAFDIGLLAGAVDDRRILLFDAHLLGATEHLERDVFELDAKVFRNDLTAGQNTDVFKHRLAAVAEAGCLDRRHLETAAQFVDDEGGERLPFDILGHDKQRPPALYDGFQYR